MAALFSPWRLPAVTQVRKWQRVVASGWSVYREARVMDTTHETLKGIRSRVVVPHSMPGLVTSRMLVMSYLDGVPLTQLGKYVKDKSPAAQKVAFRRVRGCVLRAWSLGCTGLARSLFAALQPER